MNGGMERVKIVHQDHNSNRLACISVIKKRQIDKLYLPGDVIEPNDVDLSKCMQGSGVSTVGNKFVSHKLGTLSRVNQVLMVVGKTGRYTCSAGDLILGRVVDVMHSKGTWQIDVRSQRLATLPLVNAVLPGSEQRRRNQLDQMNMRDYLDINDVVLAEVQRVSRDGNQAVLHTRNLKYGRMNNGVFIQVPASLVGRTEAQYNIVCFDETTEKIASIQPLAETPTIDGNQIMVVLGTNGGIWIGAPPEESDADTLNYSLMGNSYARVKLRLRVRIARLRALVILLSEIGLEINWKSLELFLRVSGELGYLVPELYEQEKRTEIYTKVLEDVEYEP